MPPAGLAARIACHSSTGAPAPLTGVENPYSIVAVRRKTESAIVHVAGAVRFPFVTVNVPGRVCPADIKETNASYDRPRYVPGVQTVGLTEIPSTPRAALVERSAFANPAPWAKTS